jgi:hypothetical protein
VTAAAPNRHPEALTVRCKLTGEVGVVVGLTGEKRPIIDFQGPEPHQVFVRSRSWADLVLGDGRAW